jgi:cellulose synthase/poly-beta-1,6-N-acetylglucosamine synthase-like glycosyltransferase
MLTLLAIAASLNLLVMASLALSARQKSKANLHTANTPKQEPITLIIAAHNEEENLRRFLQSALQQSFAGEYEVIIVLDRCTDGSKQVVTDLQSQNPNLRILTIDTLPEGWTGKKHALHLAIQSARHECLAFTDADCELPSTWLQGIAEKFAQGSDLILGVSPYAPQPSFLNLLIRFETWMTAILYTGLAALGKPYMGVGRSLAYRKSWFQRRGGFEKTAHRLSGDDDLLVNRADGNTKIGLLADMHTQVLSQPKTTWKAWIRQKIRHGSAGSAYTSKSLLILSLIHGLHLIFYLSLVVVLCMPAFTGWAGMIYFLRTAGMMTLLASLPWKHKAALIVAFPLLDVAYLFYLLLLAPAAAFIQPKWK